MDSNKTHVVHNTGTTFTKKEINKIRYKDFSAETFYITDQGGVNFHLKTPNGEEEFVKIAPESLLFLLDKNISSYDLLKKVIDIKLCDISFRKYSIIVTPLSSRHSGRTKGGNNL